MISMPFVLLGIFSFVCFRAVRRAEHRRGFETHDDVARD
jgi:hypothetical protein